MPSEKVETDLTNVDDVACTLCGCVCDDLSVQVKANRIQTIKNACGIAETWLHEQSSRKDHDCRVNGEVTSESTARTEAFALLTSARNPLIYGLSSSSTPGQRAACHLADRIGAIIDTSASTCHAPSIMALQRTGESTSSLGEIKHRSDLVIFWGSNPVESHPRHLERYSYDPAGEFVGEAGRNRFLVVVDTKLTETAKQADLFIQILPEKDFEVIWALRGMVKGVSMQQSSIGGVSIETLNDLATRMMNCQHGALFFGLGLARGHLAHMHVEALLSLATDLHQQTRFVVRRMRKYGDVAGADSVLCWQTGYPFSVNLNRPFPRYNPGEYSAGDILTNHEPDFALLVGTDGIHQLPNSAIGWLEQIPSVVLLHEDVELPFTPTISIPVATYGVHLPGTAYRMDETPIPLRPVLTTQLPADYEIMREWIDLIENHN